MTPAAHLRSVVPVLAVSLLVACNPGDIGGIDGILSVVDLPPGDPAQADYVLDFGDTGVGRTKKLGVVAWNSGRGPLTIFTVQAQAPFAATDGADERLLPIDARVSYEFAFSPTGAGVSTQVVLFDSDGGTVRLMLKGRGVEGLAACQLVATPSTLDFGQVALGASRTLSSSVKNEGGESCALDVVRLAARTDAAFSFVSGASSGRTLGAGESLLLEVSFGPTVAGNAQGAVEVEFGGDVLRVTLLGRFDAPCADPLPDGSCPVAREPIYVNTKDTLYSFDSGRNTTRQIGKFKQGATTISNMTDTGIDSDGVMWGVTSDKLYRINPTTAGCQLVGSLSITPNGLTVLPDGRLVAAGTGVWELSKTTGAVTETIVAPGQFDTSGDIVALPDGKLYWAAKNNNSTDRIVRIDPDSGATTVLGNVGTTSIYGLGYADGDLWGFTSGGKSLTINSSTGRGSATTNLSGTWWGATTNPTQW